LLLIKRPRTPHPRLARTRLADAPRRMIAGRAPPTKRLRSMRFRSLPTSTNNPACVARRIALLAKVFALEPPPAWRHSTLMPVAIADVVAGDERRIRRVLEVIPTGCVRHDWRRSSSTSRSRRSRSRRCPCGGRCCR
jgi:hypothetical protein